jgi:2-polyprenyl-3-methyl-5-hydroxy-6-metoxy-1,4-benzoquinol methylase
MKMVNKTHIIRKTWYRTILELITSIKEYVFLRRIYLQHIKYNPRKSTILHLKSDDITSNLIGERDVPGDKKFVKNNWWKVMLLRYGLAMHYSKGKNVLDTCSGLGWGSFLLEGVAKRITCVEIDNKCISTAISIWNRKKIDYICASVLNIPIKDNSYDVVTAMESIEHFNQKNIESYLKEIYRVLKPGGILIGSSAFPNTEEEAQALCLHNIYHKHICTQREIEKILTDQGFKRITVYKNKLFFVAWK